MSKMSPANIVLSEQKKTLRAAACVEIVDDNNAYFAVKAYDLPSSLFFQFYLVIE